MTNANAEQEITVTPTTEGWTDSVMRSIHHQSLASAGYELMKLVNFALKTQHDEQFNREVRNCVLEYWNRCERQAK